VPVDLLLKVGQFTKNNALVFHGQLITKLFLFGASDEKFAKPDGELPTSHFTELNRIFIGVLCPVDKIQC